MIITTGYEVPGKNIKEILGPVTGNTVRAKHIGKDIGAAFRGIVGGEQGGYTEMLQEARAEAMKRMEANAKRLRSDAVIGVRLSTAAVMAGSAEILAYGTAVKLK